MVAFMVVVTGVPLQVIDAVAVITPEFGVIAPKLALPDAGVTSFDGVPTAAPANVTL
jgi:hypothetical protein